MAYVKENDWSPDLFDVTDFDFWFHEDPAHDPVNIIHEGSRITACFNWTQAGSMPRNEELNEDTHYKLRVFLEQMGPGEAGGQIFEKDVDLEQGYSGDTYRYNFEHVPPGWDSLTEGVYKVVVTLNLYNPNETISRFHSFDERGFIEVVAP